MPFTHHPRKTACLSANAADTADLTAEYVSEWDGGLQVVSEARVDLTSGVVTVTVSDDEVDSLEVLDRQFVVLDGGFEFEIEERDDQYVVLDLPALWAATGFARTSQGTA